MLFRSDRKSTRLNSSHLVISYAVFCLKKKKETTSNTSIHTYLTTPAMPAPSSPDAATFRRATCCPPSRVSLFFLVFLVFFFFNDTATTEIYTLSLHDALPI